MKYLLTFLFVNLLFVGILSGQIDVNKLINNAVNKYGDEAKDFLKDKLKEKLKESKEGYEVTDFNYAISFGDNSSLYETEERFKRTRTILYYAIEGGDVSKVPPLQQARDLNEAGEMLYASNKFKGAEASFKKSLEILKKEKLMASEDAMLTLSNLGLLYHATGRYSLAEDYTLRAYEMREADKSDKTGYGASLNNLAVLYKDMGQYTQSEEYITKAVEYIQENEGETVNLSIALNNQAMLFQITGKYTEAEELLTKSIEIASKSFKEKSSFYIRLRVNMALLYQLTNRHQEAEEIYLEAINIKKKKFGTKHPDYAQMLRSLASLYMIMEKYDKVEPLLNESLKIYEKQFGKTHPSYAAALFDLAVLKQTQNKIDEALKLLSEAITIQEKKLGIHHPSLILSKEHQSIAYWQKNDLSKSISLYHNVMDEYLYQVNSNFPAMNDYEKTRFWSQIQPRFVRFYAFASSASSSNNSVWEDVYNYHIATKALLLNSSKKIKQTILDGGNPVLIAKYNEWQDLKSYISKLYSYTNEELEEDKINLAELEKQAKAIEKDLAILSSEFNDAIENTKIDYKQISAQLSVNDAAIEIIRVNNYNKLKADTGVFYLAVVIKNTGKPVAVKLPWGNFLETNISSQYLKAIKQGKSDSKFHKFLWAELEQLTDSKRNLFFSVDGIFNQISLNTLQKPDGKYILDEKEIIYVTNTKDLITLKPKINKKEKMNGRTATLIGSPNYALNLGSGNKIIADLPGTKVEVNNISKLLTNNNWNVSTFYDDEATEENIKMVSNPFVLHIATHGFFVDDINSSMPRFFGIEPQKALENPLLRSGLMLAGADRTVQNMDNKETKGSDDGILNAYEAMMLNLNKTELVVLSACETGLGEIKSGEGVYGLQRAFQIAGTNSVLISLWEVSDEGTQDLMTFFYTNWLSSGDKFEAFRQAQIQMKEKYIYPYYWGAFIMVSQ